jgi:hypothetical protein
MIYTAPYVMFLMRASGRGLGPGNQDFLGPVKRHRAVRQVPFGAQKKSSFPPPTYPSNGFARSIT